MKIGLGVGVVSLVLIIMKLAGILEVEWIWVLSPIWISLTFWAIALVFLLFICFVCLIIDKIGG